MDLETLNQTPPWEWEPDARATFKSALRDHGRSVSDRLIAAKLAGDLVVVDDEMCDLLAGIVANPAESEETRAHAAISLGPVLDECYTEEFDQEWSEPPIEEKTYRKIQDTLRRVHDDRSVAKEVRRRALEASVRGPEEWHTGAIREAYAGPDEEWKLTAVFGMRWIRGFDDEILASLESRNPDIHLEAVQAAGAHAIDLAWPHVFLLLNSPGIDKRLYLAAIEAAGSIRPAEAEPILIELATSDDEEISDAASEALTMANLDLEEDDEDGDEEEEDEDEHF